MARKSHPGGAESYWESELSAARDVAAGLRGLCARVGSVLGLAGPEWPDALESWCAGRERERRDEWRDGGGI